MRDRKHPLRYRPLSQKATLKTQQSSPSSWEENLLPGSVSSHITADTSVCRKPLVALGVGMVLLVSLLFLQLFHLQVVEGERMLGIAEGNRVRQSVDFAPRGRILDRNGVVLAENTASYQLSVVPYLLPSEEEARVQIYTDIAAVIETLEVEDIAAAVMEEGLTHPRPILLEEGIEREVALSIEYMMPRLAGFSLDAIPIREYRSDAALSHILGYVGRVSEGDLERNEDLYGLDFIGKTGIELQYDEVVRGVNGLKETEVDALGRPLRTLREIPTEPGQDIYLTIDYEMQKRLAESLQEKLDEGELEKGAGVVLDPRDGSVLASVSLPAYDNNVFAKGVSSTQYERLIRDTSQPMHNRVVEGGYPTGSIIKPFNLLGALGTGTVDEHTTIFDGGTITLPGGFTFSSWNTDGLGPMNARSAIAMSSNIYFYTVAGGYRDFQGMGIDTLNSYYRMFGLGSRTGIDLPSETNGRVPDEAWKRETMGEDWYIGDTYLQAIGQGNLLASPLQMARAYAALVNDGKMVTPKLYSERVSPADELSIPSRDFRVVQRGLDEVISFNGTTPPSIFEDVGVAVSGKSGTAETDPGRREPHSWFAAYAPRNNAELVAVVLVEEGRSSTIYSGPVIADVFEWYFNDRTQREGDR